MERAFSCAPPKSALLSSSLLCSRFPTRSWHDENPSCVGLLINYVEGHGSHHLQMACLALQRSDSFSSKGPVLGFVHSSPSTQTATPTLFCYTKLRNQACQCSAKRRSSARGPARFKYPKENFDAEDARDPQDVLCFEEDGDESEQLLPTGIGTMVRPSVEHRLASGMSGDEILASEGVDQNDRTNWNSTVSNEGTSIPVKEPIYEVLEVKVGGSIVTKSVSRRRLLKTSGLRLRDIRSVDPSLWVTNSAPALLIRDHAVLLNLGSLRAIASADSVLLFDYKSIGATAFLDSLLHRLNPDPGVPAMPFELEVVEAALLSRTQRLERRLMEVEPRVLALLKVLPNRMTANVLEELRLSKQALVELGSKANALRQMLLELLESPQEIRRMTIMGRRCTISKADGRVECVISADKQLAHEEEEEMEMLLENYLQRCESCHGQAERLLDSSKEMEDSIAVNLSSRRLEVSRLELLLQVGTFCSALGALVAGIFGMNLKSYLEENMIAFWCTSAGIIIGGIVLFFLMYNHLKQRKIL